MFPQALAGLDPDQLAQMMAKLSGSTAGPPADAGGDNPFRRAADQQGGAPELQGLPPEQLDAMLGQMKASPAGGGMAKTPSAVADAPVAPSTQRAMPAQAQQPAAFQQTGFRPSTIQTNAPGTIGQSVIATNPNEEIAALLKQQYNTGFSDFMGAGSPLGDYADERMKPLAASLGQNRANMFGDLYNQNQARQFAGGQADLNRTFQGNESALERAMRMGLADKQGANQLAVQGLQNQGAIGTEKLRGENQIASIIAADKAGNSTDKLATQAYMQSYAANIAAGKDSVSANASAQQVADNVRTQANRGGQAQGPMPPTQLPPGFENRLIVGSSAPGQTQGAMGPNPVTIGRVDQIFKGVSPSLTPSKEGVLTPDQINAATDMLMSQKLTPVEAQELARRIKAGELGDFSKIEAALAQQTAGNYLLAQPPTRDKAGAYPSQYQIPNMFTMRANPAGGLGSRTAAGMQNLATGGLPVPTTNGMGFSGFSGQGVPYNEVVLPGGRTVPFNPTEFRSVGGELSGANAKRKESAQQRAAYQGMLLDALMNGPR